MKKEIKKRINVHATRYKFAKCNFDRCKEQHSNNISIIISEKIKQQTKELFALIKFQESGTSIPYLGNVAEFELV